MKTLLILLALITGITVVVYAVLQPDKGVIYQDPVMPLALGLIGVGLCKQARHTA